VAQGSKVVRLMRAMEWFSVAFVENSVDSRYFKKWVIMKNDFTSTQTYTAKIHDGPFNTFTEANTALQKMRDK
jgi:hypothetical protein